MILIGIGIGIWLGVFIASIKCNPNDRLAAGFIGFIVGAMLGFLSFLLLGPNPDTTSISEDDYIKAIGAKNILETNPNINNNNIDEMQICLKILTDYQDKRNKIFYHSKSIWNGEFYSQESLKKYPPVKLDNKVKTKI